MSAERKSGAEGEFIADIPYLVNRAINARPDRARKFEAALLEIMESNQDYGLVLKAVEKLQSMLLTIKDPKNMRVGMGLLHQALLRGSQASDESPKILRWSLEIERSINTILKSHHILSRNRYLESHLPPIYWSLVEESLPGILKMRQDHQVDQINLIPRQAKVNEENINNHFGLNRTGLDFLDQSKSPVARTEQLQEWNKWWFETVTLLNDKDRMICDPLAKDELVSKLRTEPDIDMDSFFNTKYAGICLGDIERMKDPGATVNFYTVIDYLHNIILNTKTYGYGSRYDNLLIVTHLFFRPAIFYTEAGPVEFRNKQLLANLNSWQEDFSGSILSKFDDQIESKVRDILKLMPDYAGMSLLTHLLTWATKPYILDPEYHLENQLEIMLSHPLTQSALKSGFVQVLPSGSYSSDEICKEALKIVLLPKLQERLEELEVVDKYGSFVRELRDRVDKDYSMMRIEELKRRFEDMAGDEFLKNLTRRSWEIQAVTKAIWHKTENSISEFIAEPWNLGMEFSADSLPAILGMKSIRVLKLPGNRYSVEFVLKENRYPGGYGFAGDLDNDGQLRLKIPLIQKMPGLYRILNYIVVAAIYDLLQAEQIKVAKQPQVIARLLDQELVEPEEDKSSNKSNKMIEFANKIVQAVLKNRQGGGQEKTKNIESTTTFIKGEVFEQLIGILLGYTHADELVVPQYCLDVGVNEDGKGYYRIRVDFKAGDNLYEVKWGNAPEDIKSTINLHLGTLAQKGIQDRFKYNLITFLDRSGLRFEGDDKVNIYSFDRFLDSLVGQDDQIREHIEMIALVLFESASQKNQGQVEFLTKVRDFLYNVKVESDLIWDKEEKQRFLKKVFQNCYELITGGETNNFLNFGNYMDEHIKYEFSSTEAFFEYQGMIYRGSIQIIEQQGGDGNFDSQDLRWKENLDDLKQKHYNSDAIIEIINKDIVDRGFKPRTVKMHRRGLHGAYEYKTIVEKWDSCSKEERRVLIGHLEKMRRQMHKISKEKLRGMAKLPPDFQLEYVVDPITKGVVYLQTWVVDHSSPKPTKEELNSLVVMFDRYYSNGSALSFLDQIKPWFVGEAFKEPA